MMTIQEIYLSLLKSAVWNKPVDELLCRAIESGEYVDWNLLLQLCQKQGTSALIFNQILKLKGTGMPDTSLCNDMKQVCLQNMLSHKQWHVIIQNTWKALDGITPVMLKGFALAQLYPLPYLRQWGDLDVWCGENEYHSACEKLRNAFPNADHTEEEWERLKHYNFVFPNGMVIELHRVSMTFLIESEQRYYQHLESKGLINSVERMDYEGMDIAIPEACFNLLFTFLHAWEHFCGTGMPMKQVCDMALLAHQSYGMKNQAERAEMDAYLRDNLRYFGMLEVWQMVGAAIVKMLDLPAEEWPLYTAEKEIAHRAERFISTVLEEGQCRKKVYADGETDRKSAWEKANNMPVLKRKWITLQSRFEESKMLCPYAPEYARHLLLNQIRHGIRRTIRREEIFPI